MKEKIQNWLHDLGVALGLIEPPLPHCFGPGNMLSIESASVLVEEIPSILKAQHE